MLPLIPTKPARFQAGQRPLVGNDFELIELLGSGGFGEVWRAKHIHMPSAPDVALKFCLDAAAAKTLRNEAALLGRIMQQGDHSGIVKLQQTYLRADIPALQYEYIAGGDLADLIKHWYAQPTPPSIDVVRDALLELAETLAFAHAAGIVHRDLKPANILIPVGAAFVLSPEPEASAPGANQRFSTRESPGADASGSLKTPRFKIADFGIGSIQADIDHRTQRAHTVGQRMAQSLLGSHTPLYASPEQANGKASHTADDTFALGVIWHQMLTGDLNIGAPTGMDWPDDLRERGLGDAEIAVLGACFNRRAKRHQDAQKLADKLRELIVAFRSEAVSF